MGKTLTISDIPEPVYDRFAAVARQHQRNAEAHGRFLIEQATALETCETCGEILAAHEQLPPPNVDLAPIEAHQMTRGGRARLTSKGD